MRMICVNHVGVPKASVCLRDDSSPGQGLMSRGSDARAGGPGGSQAQAIEVATTLLDPCKAAARELLRFGAERARQQDARARAGDPMFV